MGPKIPLITVIFILALIGGTYFRFSDALSRVPNQDELIVMVAAAKLNSNHTNYDPRTYNFEHPFLGKKIIGSLVPFLGSTLIDTIAIPVNLYTYTYLAMPELKEHESGMRAVEAFFGLLFLLPVFLITQKIFNVKTGLITTIVLLLSAGFINLSRYLTQDGILLFFYFSTVYFFLEYVTENAQKTWGKIPLPHVWGGLTLLFWGLSLLVRIHQPLLLGAGMIAALYWVRRPIAGFLGGMALTICLGAIAYSSDAIGLMVYVQSLGQTIELQPAHAIRMAAGLVTQNSYTFLALAGGFIVIGFQKPIQERIKKIREVIERKNDKNVVHQLIFWLTVLPIIGIIFSALGAQPRYYLIAFVLPIIYICHIGSRFFEKNKIILAGIVVVDILLLLFVAPPYMEYSVLGQNPIFLKDETILHEEIIARIDAVNVNHYFTNDARLILRDERAVPLPPNWSKFYYYGLCTRDFTEQFHKAIIVYLENVPMDESTFVCNRIDFSKIKPIPAEVMPPLSPYQFYMVVDSNQLPFTAN